MKYTYRILSLALLLCILGMCCTLAEENGENLMNYTAVSRENFDQSVEELRNDISQLVYNHISMAAWSQGGWLDITDYAGGKKNTVSARINTSLENVSIKRATIHVDEGYSYMYAVFDSANKLLAGTATATWPTEDTVLNLIEGTGTTIRLSLRHADNSDIDPTEGVHIKVTTTLTDRVEEVAEDMAKLDNIATALDGNISNGLKWTRGTWLNLTDYATGYIKESTIRIASSFVHDGLDTIHIHADSGYKFGMSAYDANNNLVAQTSWRGADVNWTFDHTVVYVRINLAKSDDSTITIDDAKHIVVKPYRDAPERMSDVRSAVAALSDPVKLRVCTYNVGQYSYGMNTWTPEENAVQNLKNFLCDYRFDILGLQENVASVNGIDINADVYGSIYRGQYDILSAWESIKTHYELLDAGQGTFTAKNRKYAYATINVGGKEVFLMSVHFALTHDDRISNYAEMQAILANHERWIVFGDFNAGLDNDSLEQAQEEYAIMINSGARAANGGMRGMLMTHANDSSHVANRDVYLDNIFCSPNIYIVDSGVLNVDTTMNSDHRPVWAELVI